MTRDYTCAECLEVETEVAPSNSAVIIAVGEAIMARLWDTHPYSPQVQNLLRAHDAINDGAWWGCI